MLYPQNNAFRQSVDLSGFWDFRFAGEGDDWHNGFDDARPIAVPASWNEIFADDRDHLGPAFYQTRFALPWGWAEKRVCLRFGSVGYLAQVWLNGDYLGEHEGGHLPFTFEVTDQLQPEANLLVVRVDGRMGPNQVPPGNLTPRDPLDMFSEHRRFPDTTYDFYPFCGIQRPVLLYAVPKGGIDDITVATDLDGATGIVRVKTVMSGAGQITLQGHGSDLQAALHEGSAEVRVPNARLWGIGQPNLYTLTVEQTDGATVTDRYALDIGIRTVQVAGDQLLLNGEPVYLRGFGRHEDSAINGRGYQPAVIVKDYALMQWIGANSFRTSHYPYSEQQMLMADRLGLLIIDEIPAVGLYFRPDGLDSRLALCKQQLNELMARDKNHPSVIMWSIANEPHSLREGHQNFFRALYDQVKAFDSTRPVTLVSHVGLNETSFEFLDVVCYNRYRGWYQQPGQIVEGVAALVQELDDLYARYGKPIILTEFGADAVPGMHSYPPEMFSEEYQAEYLEHHVQMLRTRPYMIGEHVWNMCDFKTPQSIRRVAGLNFKGVFTRDRRPKMAAFKLRELWAGVDRERAPEVLTLSVTAQAGD
jgi:beta-glucuronidase